MTTTFYQVGGSVRDRLLGLTPKDIDYAVEADSFETMEAAIRARGGEIFLSKPEYLTIRAKVPALGACDFVLCRKDGAYYDGRRPETVTPGTIYDDLARRDFTCNAMALTEDGTLIDPHGGEDDTNERLLRCVGDAVSRFSEDGLRMLRALRFSITKRFIMDDDIYECLATESFFRPRLIGVSKERIREELLRCFQCDTYSTVLALMDDFADLGKYLLCESANNTLWLKPTLEAR